MKRVIFWFVASTVIHPGIVHESAEDIFEKGVSKCAKRFLMTPLHRLGQPSVGRLRGSPPRRTSARPRMPVGHYSRFWKGLRGVMRCRSFPALAFPLIGLNLVQC